MSNMAKTRGPIEELVLEDGKYTFQYEAGRMIILRYGEQWREVTGDKAIGALFSQVRDQQDLLRRVLAKVENMDDRSSDSCSWQSAELSDLVQEIKTTLGE